MSTGPRLVTAVSTTTAPIVTADPMTSTGMMRPSATSKPCFTIVKSRAPRVFCTLTCPICVPTKLPAVTPTTIRLNRCANAASQSMVR